ncbi:MAG: YbaY family lipoprotein [Parvularculaceae bacterium]
MIRPHVIVFMSFLIAACSGQTDLSEPENIVGNQVVPGEAAATAVIGHPFAEIQSQLSLSPWIRGSYSAGDVSSEFVAFLDGDMPIAIFEQQDFGDYGAARVAHYYDSGAFSGSKKWARQLSNAGAPSDGWYESEMTIVIENGRFVSGEKTVNGEPSEPDEHEIRSAGRVGNEMKARVIAILEGYAPNHQTTPNRQLILWGTLEADEPVTLPAGTIARIQIRDASRQDIAAEVIASEDREINTLPTDFTMAATRALISKNAKLGVFVQIVSGDDLLYITAERAALDPSESPASVTAKLIRVGDFNPPETAPSAGSGGMMITPPQTAYVCGGERLLIALEAGAAFVTFPDKTSLRLPLLPAAEENGAATFTNGKMTVLSRRDKDGAAIIDFARGRAAFVRCSPA